MKSNKRCCDWNPQGQCCGASSKSRRAAQSNGATAGCWREFIDSPLALCANKLNRSLRPNFFAGYSGGNMPPQERNCAVNAGPPKSFVNCKVLRFPLANGSVTFSLEESAIMILQCW